MPLMPRHSPKCAARISAPSRLAAKADVVVQIEHIEPGGYIFAQFARLLVQFVEVLARVGIGGDAGVVEGGPLGDFPWLVPISTGGRYPLENRASPLPAASSNFSCSGSMPT